MEAKVTRLETQMGHVQAELGEVKSRLGKVEDRIGRVETGLATLTERVAHLPSKEYMVKIALGTVGFLTAITIFSDKIRAMVGLA